MRFRAFFAILALAAAAAQAQPAFLVRDINTTPSSFVPEPPGSRPNQLTPAQGGKLFFRTGNEYKGSIWVTDGTPGGTVKLPGDCPDGDCTRAPGIVGTLRNLAFWVEPRQGGILWRSDGTWAGTFPLNDPPLLQVRLPDESDAPIYAFAGGFLYFRGCFLSGTINLDCELWRTDGTREGTRLVLGITPGPRGSKPVGLTPLGNRVLFVANRDTPAPSIWVSDGTATGTTRVRDLPGSSTLSLLTAAGGKLFFLLRQEEEGEEELWVSDGTEAGTRAVSRFVPPLPFGQTEWLKPAGNLVYFLADDVEHGTELWRSDGTPQGTVRVTDFGFNRPFGSNRVITASQIEAAGGRIVFLATDGLNGYRYWSTAGTPGSTVALADPCPGSDCEDVFDDPDSGLVLAPVGGRVVLTIRDEQSRSTAWSTDGTAAGTVRLPSPVMQSLPRAVSGAVFFLAGGDLWRTDGRPEGTRRFAGLPASTSPAIGRLEIAALGGRLYFNLGSSYGEELWASDGTPEGTALVADIAAPLLPGSHPNNLTAFGNLLLFGAYDGQRADLWHSSGTAAGTAALGLPAGLCSSGAPALKLAGDRIFYLDTSCAKIRATNGTAAGTILLPGVVSSASAPEPDPLVVHQGAVWFLSLDGEGIAIWKSDGTIQGTGRAFHLPAGANGPARLTSLGPDLYFTALDSQFRRQVWRTDGTAAGTRQLTSFDGEGEELALDPLFTRAGSTVFFVTDGEHTHGFGNLWGTDGTAAGTRRIFSPSQTFGRGPRALTAFAGALYFFYASDGDGSSWALWRSDGTPFGTVLVKDLGYQDREVPIEPTVIGNELFFVAGTDGQGIELWKSDGTAEGTRVVRDILPGPSSSSPTGLTAAGGKLYFAADDGLHGFELWESDGTEAGTRLVHDINPLSGSSSPAELTQVGNLLFFRADDGVTGSELWALPLGAGSGACQPSPTQLCLGGGRFRVEAHWKDFSGNTGQGRAVALTSDTGYFWFFDPANVEVIAKVLDGRGVNDHHWVFYGALSNVEYSITVTDTQTGLTRRYFNPSGRFASVGDTTGFGPSWDFPGKDTSVAPAAAAPLVSGRTDPKAKAPCVASATRLCLNDNRFAVEVSWKDFSGNTGTGKAVGLTGDTGYFWFFDDDNVELVLKVLDGRPVNGKFWLFYGALSSVEYTITVTDTETGAVKTYKNPSGRLGSVGDTGAF